MKKLLPVLAVGVLSFSLIVAAAASLGFSASPSKLGAGASLVTSCASSTGISYTSSFDTTQDAYVVTAVVLVFDSADCAGATARITLLNAAGAEVAESLQVVPAAADRVTLSLTGKGAYAGLDAIPVDAIAKTAALVTGP